MTSIEEKEQAEMLKPINAILKDFELCNSLYVRDIWSESEVQKELSLTDSELYECAIGASKFVLFPEELDDWIIKIPIKGFLEYENQRNVFTKSSEALPNETRYNSWDYCETEEKIYNAAKALGIEHMFAETRYIGTKDKYPIYISEKMYDIGDFKDNYKVKLLPEVEDLLCKMYGYIPDDEWEFIPSDVFQEMYKAYGKQNVIKFVTFLAAEGIRDFHTFNFGWSLAGEPVIIDYAGFFD